MLPDSPSGLGRDLFAQLGLVGGASGWPGKGQASRARNWVCQISPSPLELEMSSEIIWVTHLISQRCTLRSQQDQVMVTSLSSGPAGASDHRVFPASVSWAVFSLLSAGPRAVTTDNPTPQVAHPYCFPQTGRCPPGGVKEGGGVFGGGGGRAL